MRASERKEKRMPTVSLSLSLRRQSRGTPDPFISISAHTHTHRAPTAVKNGCGRFLAGDLGGKKEEGNKTRERAQFFDGREKKRRLARPPLSVSQQCSHQGAQEEGGRRSCEWGGGHATEEERRGERGGRWVELMFFSLLTRTLAHAPLTPKTHPLSPAPPPHHHPPPPRPRPHHAFLPVRPPAGPPRPVCGCGR